MANIKIKYKKGDEYKIFPINGALGSVNMQGLVLCDFYLERLAHPTETELSFDESTGEVTDKGTKSKEGQRVLTRELLVGIAVQPEVARLIGEWLIRKADEYQKRAEDPK